MDHRSDYLYHLPESLIAQQPAEPRDSSRLLVLDRTSGTRTHSAFHHLPDFLHPGDSLVFNNSKVIPARLLGRRESGGQIELLLLEEIQPHVWDCLARPAKKLPVNSRILFPGNWSARVVAESPAGRRSVRFASADDSEAHPAEFHSWLHRHGAVPLPPYIRRPPSESDRERYQTVYARHEGSVAAPTAGLHFTPGLLRTLETAGIGLVHLTLHVGIGTFRPVEVEHLEDHVMDEERYILDETAAAALNTTRARGGRIIAVGTTTVRTLETAAAADGLFHPQSGRASLFIRPPYRFRAVDALVTNFHLPGSTLLMLVSAFAGRQTILSAYREAVATQYLFFSYGDAMLII